MTRINIRRRFNMIKVFDAEGSIIATFANHPASELLCGLMLSGLAPLPAYEVYDMDAGQVVVGDLGSMAA